MPSPGRRFKNAIYEQFGRVAKALASPHRIELVELLAQGPRTVEALGRMADMSLANTSAHLQVLRTAGLSRRASLSTPPGGRARRPGGGARRVCPSARERARARP